MGNMLHTLKRTFYQLAFASVFLATGYLAMISGEQNSTAPSGIATLDAPATATRILLRTGADAEIIRGIQKELQARGYHPGAANGHAGLQTRAAVMAWQHDTGRKVTGELGSSLLQAMIFDSRPVTNASLATPPAAHAITRAVEKLLAELGYAPGPVDGHMDPQTARAVTAFEKDRSLPATGRISGRLIAEIRAITRN